MGKSHCTRICQTAINLERTLKYLFSIAGLAILAIISFTEGNAQEVVKTRKHRRLHIGLYTGGYFASNTTASAYNGYGFDLNGNPNSFANSIMYRSIVQDYGGGNNGNDRIAAALGVPPGTWNFSEADMPVNTSYTVAFLMGIQGRINLSKRDILMFNLNFANLNVTGNFVIELPQSTTYAQQINTSNDAIFPLRGTEQRLMGQIGYQRLLGEPGTVNCFYELGAEIIYTKFVSEQLYINSLTIDLTPYYIYPGYGNSPGTMVGTGGGMFGGFGVNITNKYSITLQLVYDLTYETLRYADVTDFMFQHSIGLRAYW